MEELPNLVLKSTRYPNAHTERERKSYMQYAVEEQQTEFENIAQKDQYLNFVCGQEHYCVNIRYVTEIVGIQPITNMPDLPGYVKGIINLRGRIIPVIDVRLLFGMHQKEYDDRTCIIVIIINDASFGLIIDRVTEVLNIPECNIVPNPYENSDQNKRYVKNIGKVGSDVMLILDCEKMIDVDQLKYIGIKELIRR